MKQIPFYSLHSLIIKAMGDCLSRAAMAPVTYVKHLRELSIPDLTMKGTPMYPAFPLSALFALLSMLAFAIYMAVYFFTEDRQEKCYAHIIYGIMALAVAYPVESIIIMLGLIGSAAGSTCWKYFVVVFLGLMGTGFSFGGLGFVYLCTINEANPILIPSSFLSSNTFIQIVVYMYLSFFGLYIILIPLLTCSYGKREQEAEGTCTDRFCCIMFYFFNILFCITAICMLAIKVVGPPLLIYVLVQEVRSGLYSSSGIHRPFFALAILSVCLPLFIFVVVKLIDCIFCREDSDPPVQQEQTKKQLSDLNTAEQSKNQVSTDRSHVAPFLTNQTAKEFQDEHYRNLNNKL